MKIEERISKRVKKAIEDKVFPGCVIGLVRKNGERLILPFGNFTYDNNSIAVEKNSIYDIASITKSIPTSSLLLSLVDKGVIDLNDPVVKYIPKFGNSEDKKIVTISNLLTYTIDIDTPPLSLLKDKTADEIINIILNAPLRRRAGTSFFYTNSTACLIGLVIRSVSGQNIDDLADREFFVPLGMDRSTFHPDKFNKDNIVPTEFDDWRNRIIQGEVHDESTFVLNKKFILGASGLFSTASDILKFLEMLLNKGILGGKRYFSEKMVYSMAIDQASNTDGFVGLGWGFNLAGLLGKHCSRRVFGKTGFTGTLCACDLDKEVAYVILSNRTFPKRPDDSSAINDFRSDVGDIILGSF